MYRALSSIFLGVLLLMSASPALAADKTHIVLYPTGARVTVDTTMTPVADATGQPALNITLPSLAAPASFTLAVEGRTIVDVSSQSVEATPSATKAKLVARRTELQGELARILAMQDAVKARTALWAGAGQGKSLQPAELERLDTLMEKHLVTLYGEAEARQKQAEAIRKQIVDYDGRIARLGGDEVAARMTARLAGSSSAPVRLRYSYTLAGCGWTPNYRLDARPDEGSIRFSHEAELHQAADQEWKDMEISIASADPGGRLQPPPFVPWIIGPRPEPMPRTLKAAPVMMDRAPLMAAVEDAPYVQELEQATYSVWDLGRRTLNAGEPLRVTLASGQWAATFRHTIRPARDKFSFLEAHVVIPEGTNPPMGPALHLVDGAAVGSNFLSPTGRELNLFFGSDPRVTAVMKPLKSQSGKSGIIDRSQTYNWAWDMVVSNQRSRPAAVRVEDAAPRVRDAAIVVERRATPAAAEKDDILFWDMTLAPGATQTINLEIDVVAPAGMRLDLGR